MMITMMMMMMMMMMNKIIDYLFAYHVPVYSLTMDTGRRTAVIEIGLTPCTNISGITDASEFVNLIDTASSKKENYLQ